MEGEGMTPEREKQPAIGNSFDTKLKALFADVDPRVDEWKVSYGRPTVSQDVDGFVTAEDKFTNDWWERLYKWLDVNDFHREKGLVARSVIESLDSIPPDTKLPKNIKWNWIDLNNDSSDREPERKQVMDALINPSISASLKLQLGKYLAESYVTPYSVDSIMEDYKIFGEKVGDEVRGQIFPLMIMDGAYDKFEEYEEYFINLYEHEGESKGVGTEKSQNLFQKIGSRFKRSQRNSQEQESEKRSLAERRVEAIRNLVLEIFPPLQEDPDGFGQWRRLSHFTGISSGKGSGAHLISKTMSTLSVETLEQYLSDLKQLKTLPEFENLSRNIASWHSDDEGLVSPYVALGRATRRFLFRDEYVPVNSVLGHINEINKDGKLNDQIVDDILRGMEIIDQPLPEKMTELTELDKQMLEEEKTVARRNLKILMQYSVPNNTRVNHLLISPGAPEEEVLKYGLETMKDIQTRDEATAGLVVETLPNFEVFGDKYNVAFDYFKIKRDRGLLRRINGFTHGDYIKKAMNGIQLTSSGRRQGERLIKLAASLDTIRELTEEGEVGVDDLGIVSDLRQSYENVQQTLKGVLQRLGIESLDLDEVYKFLPWIKTKDETALKILRGEEVPKIGEAKSYTLQAGSKIDLEEIRKEVENYARSIGLDFQVPPTVDLDSLKEIARQIMSQLDQSSDIPEDLLGEIKPNLDRIITTANKGGVYEFSINPQDLKGQLEALQNVGSCLSPGGSMFRYTKQYLANPNTSWAIVKGNEGIVGRVTVFRGKDEEGNSAIARVSKVYAQVPIDEDEVDQTLKKYADETNVAFVEEGEIEVTGLYGGYDDFIGQVAYGDKFVVRR